LSQTTVLVADDEPSVLRLLAVALDAAGLRCLAAGSGAEALAIAQQDAPDLALLSITLPDLSGHEVCRQIREYSTIPILLMSVLRHEHNAALGVEAGADGCVAKPFGVGELVSRVRGQLSLAKQLPSVEGRTELECDRGRLVVDLGRRLAHRHGRVLPLGSTQFRLLAHLAASAGRTVSFEELGETLWGPDGLADLQLLLRHVDYLRRHAEEHPQRPRLIATHESGLQLSAS
jgi:two-component system KDP operon response regulator KdpE